MKSEATNRKDKLTIPVSNHYDLIPNTSINPPSLHDPLVLHRHAQHMRYSFCLKGLVVREVARNMAVTASGGEGSGDTEEGNFLASKVFG
jgi:hypothetical protein